MTFHNAYHGVKKVFTAKLLRLIGAACALIGLVIALLTAGDTIVSVVTSGMTEADPARIIGVLIVSVILVIAFLVLSLIGFIMNLVGLAQAGKDDSSLSSAFIISIFSFIIQIVSYVFMALNVSGGFVDNIARAVASVCEIIVFVLIVNGITSLAEQLRKTEIIGTGTKLLVVYVISYGLAIVANLVVMFFGVTEATAVIAVIMFALYLVFSMISYIVYLVFLGKAKNMLRDN